MPVWFHPAARAELSEVRRWYAERSVLAGVAVSHEIERTLGRITENPLSFPVRFEPFREAFLKRFPLTLVFRVRAESVEIVAVSHQSRLPGYWRQR